MINKDCPYYNECEFINDLKGYDFNCDNCDLQEGTGGKIK